MIARNLTSTFVIALALTVAFQGGTARASLIAFADVYTPSSGGVRLDRAHSVYSFVHDINDSGFNPRTDSLLATAMAISFGNNRGGGLVYQAGFLLGGSPQCTRSFAWSRLGVGGAVSALVINVAQLHQDGLLSVTIRRIAGDFFFKGSVLGVIGSRIAGDPNVPVPEPASALLLACGAIGAAFAGSRARAARRAARPASS